MSNILTANLQGRGNDMAENAKNYDRFYQPNKVRVILSSSSTTFPSITTTGTGNIVNVSESPMASWTLQVTGVGGIPTAWNVVLEGSVDGITFTEILKHQTIIGNGESVFSGTTLFLSNYYRVNVVSLTLGPATSIDVHVVGKQ